MAYTTIDKPSQYFNAVLYTGNDATNRSITGVGFKPDFTWIKSRSNIYYHELYDVVRGFSSTTNGRVLYSNATVAEATPNTFNSFNTDGFTVSKQTGETGTNGNGSTYLAWNWLASNTTTSNTVGSITSTVSANTTAGFSIVGWTGTGATATVGHGLGTTPKMFIVRERSEARNWPVLTTAIDGSWDTFYLNATDASGNALQSANSTVFNFTSSNEFNASGQTYIAYCFVDIKGYSKFATYKGNGSANGTFIYTGFKPAYIGFKKTSAAGTNWVTSNNKVNPSNAVAAYLHQNLDSDEATGSRDVDFLSNGFKIRNSNSTWNESGATFFYMAFAENPFVSSTYIPTTAR